VTGERLDAGVFERKQLTVDLTHYFDRIFVPVLFRRADTFTAFALARLYSPNYGIASFARVIVERHEVDRTKWGNMAQLLDSRGRRSGVSGFTWIAVW
jgi:hypothetical protein